MMMMMMDSWLNLKIGECNWVSLDKVKGHNCVKQKEMREREVQKKIIGSEASVLS